MHTDTLQTRVVPTKCPTRPTQSLLLPEACSVALSTGRYTWGGGGQGVIKTAEKHRFNKMSAG